MRQPYTKNRQNLNFYGSHNGLQQWTDRDPYRKASCKRPRKIQNVSIFMKYNHRPNLLRQCKTNNNKQANKQTKTSTGLQVPGLRQAHNVCGRVKPVSEISTPLTWDSGETKQ